MQDGSKTLGRLRTPSRYHTRLSKRYTTHHGSHRGLYRQTQHPGYGRCACCCSGRARPLWPGFVRDQNSFPPKPVRDKGDSERYNLQAASQPMQNCITLIDIGSPIAVGEIREARTALSHNQRYYGLAAVCRQGASACDPPPC